MWSASASDHSVIAEKSLLPRLTQRGSTVLMATDTCQTDRQASRGPLYPRALSSLSLFLCAMSQCSVLLLVVFEQFLSLFENGIDIIQ